MAPGGAARNATAGEYVQPTGRWPANIVHDGSEEVLAAFPDASGGGSISNRSSPKTQGIYGAMSGEGERWAGYEDSSSAARFFYTAKADKLDRIGSKHPTVKPVDLMQWLVRLVTPPKGLVLDPFAGSGSTGEAAWREGMRCILIEREAEYQADIAERLRLADKGPATRKARAVKQAANDNLPLFGSAEAMGGGTR
jgi:site-specific DNA-methyltransferase (adenine-specific)